MSLAARLRVEALVATLVVGSMVAVAAPSGCTFPTIVFGAGGEGGGASSTASSAGGATTSTASSTASSTATVSSSSMSSSSHTTTTTTTTTMSSSAAGGGGGGGGSTTSAGGGGSTSQGSTGGAGGAGGCSPDGDGDGIASIDCGGDDCADGDDRAHPGQMTFYPGKIKGQRADGYPAYDYNCDLIEEKKFPDQANCAGTSDCSPADKWLGPAPACGEMGEIAHCMMTGNILAPCKLVHNGTMRVQACR